MMLELVFRWLARWPLKWMQHLGAGLGWCVWALSPRYRRQFRAQVTAAGVPWREARPAIAAAGRMLAELPWVWMRPVEPPLGDQVRWEGAQALEDALAEGKGAILLSPHLGCWEAGAQALAERLGPRFGPMVALYRPARKPALEAVVAKARTRPFLASSPTTLAGVRTLIRALRQGGYTAILPDQVPPEGQGVWAPMWGQPAYTMTLAGRLAQQTGAAVLLVWCERLAPGRGFVMHIERVSDPDFGTPTATPESAARVLNTWVERMVRQAPGQYLWGYNRAKQPRQETGA